MVVTLPVTVKFPVTVTIVIQILGVNISCTTTSPPKTSAETPEPPSITSKASLTRMTITVTRYFQSVPFIPATIWTFVIRWSIYVNFIFYLISFTLSGFVLYTIKNHASGV